MVKQTSKIGRKIHQIEFEEKGEIEEELVSLIIDIEREEMT